MSLEDRNIILTGFMGTGKTTVGKLVAEQLGRSFADVDLLIERQSGMSIKRIFAAHSEPFFRAMEKTLLTDLFDETRLVISTGGGALMDEGSRQRAIATGFVVCLTAPPDVIERRLMESDSRPLAISWRELYEKRLPVYQSFPYQIETVDKSPEQVAEELITLWHNDIQSQ